MDESISPGEEGMNPTNQPVSFYGDNNRSTDGALLAALVSKDSYAPALDAATNSALGCARDQIGDIKFLVKDAESNIRHDVGDAECNIRHDVKDSESNIRREVAKTEADIRADVKSAECEVIKKLGDVECKIIKENSDQTLYLTNQLSVIREQGIRNEFETKLSAERVIKEVNDKAQYNADRAGDKLQALKDFSADKFCSLAAKGDANFFALSTQLAKCCCEQEVAGVQQTGLLNTIISALNVGGPGNS